MQSFGFPFRFRCLAGGAAGKAKHLLQQRRVAFASALAEPQILPDHPPDRVFIESIRELGPGDVRRRVDHRVSAPVGKRLEGWVTRVPVFQTLAGDPAPEPLSQQRLETVGLQERLGRIPEPQSGDLPQEERADVEGGDPSREAVASRFDAPRGAPGDHDLQGVMIDDGLELGGPVRQSTPSFRTNAR
ncbi:MAG: hypothetical protein ACRD6R_06565 [Candidatus Polarisedimenticolia bacterium]